MWKGSTNMLDPKQIHEMDQAFAGIIELIPIMRKIYLEYIKEGFTKEQAFEFVRDTFTRKAPEVK